MVRESTDPFLGAHGSGNDEPCRVSLLSCL